MFTSRDVKNLPMNKMSYFFLLRLNVNQDYLKEVE